MEARISGQVSDTCAEDIKSQKRQDGVHSCTRKFWLGAEFCKRYRGMSDRGFVSTKVKFRGDGAIDVLT